jgi:hypothetical protein
MNRLTDWPTTGLGIGILAFLAVICWRHPLLLDKPELIILLATGLAGLLMKGSK